MEFFLTPVFTKYFHNLLTFLSVCPQSCAKHMCWGGRASSSFLSVKIFWSLWQSLVRGGTHLGSGLSVFLWIQLCWWKRLLLPDGCSCSLLEGSAPPDPWLELLLGVQHTPAPVAWMHLAGAKGENEQFVLIWSIWTRAWNQLHKWDEDISSKKKSWGQWLFSPTVMHHAASGHCKRVSLEESLRTTVKHQGVSVTQDLEFGFFEPHLRLPHHCFMQ